MFKGLKEAREARWDIVARLTKEFTRAYNERNEFQASIIKGKYDKPSKCKYCNRECIWVETTKGWRLQEYGGDQHKCEEYKFVNS